MLAKKKNANAHALKASGAHKTRTRMANRAVSNAPGRLSGFATAAVSGPDKIERAPTGITAFVGRTLKGPVNRPVANSCR